MHICMLLPERFPPDVRVEKETATLRAAGHEITLICRGGPAEPTFERIDGIDVQRLPVDELFAGPRGLVDGARYVTTAVHPVWRRTIEELADEDLPGGSIDALHVHDLPLVKTALAVGDDHDVPVIADLHENYPKAVHQIHRMRGWCEIARDPEDLIQRIFLSPTRLKRLERNAVRNADRTITVCEEARAHYLRDCGAAPERVKIVSNTVDLDAFDRDAAETPASLGFDPDEACVISYVGNFTEHRGLDTLIEGVARLAESRSDVQLVLVGKGNDNYVAGLERLARSLGIGDRLTLTGWVDFDDVPDYIAASDVCAVPHAATPHTETTVPHKLFQYMAMGVPVVTSDVAPLARIVTRTESGRVVPAGDGAAMGAALDDLADPDRARECGENGRQAVERRYNWTHDGARLRAIYDEL